MADLKLKKILKLAIIWVVAIIITLVAGVYQKRTGPTYPKRINLTVAGKEYTFNLLRTHGGKTNAKIDIQVENSKIDADLVFRKYPTNDKWDTVSFVRNSDVLSAELPNQPPAGKLEYYVVFSYENQKLALLKENPVVIRFKGDVPMWALIPHIFFIFFAMMFSNLSGILAAFKFEQQRFYGLLTLIFLIIGGLIFGPIVQKYAFGEYWTGVPFGWDLTDNKTLIGFLGWLVAFGMNRKKSVYWITILAALLVLVVFSIPHSMFGSQLDPNTGKVIQGFILYLF